MATTRRSGVPSKTSSAEGQVHRRYRGERMSGETAFVRLLLVEDAPEMRALVRYWLEGDGRFEVVAEAADGATAVALAEQVQPDVVVLDLYLPVLDGI